jgi:hypothetical protein
MEGDSMTDDERLYFPAWVERLLAENKRLRAPVGTGQVQTHHAECWRQRHHHACAVAYIERLAQEVEGLRITSDLYTANPLPWEEVERLRALLVSEVEAVWEAMPNPEYRSAWQKKQWVQARLVALGLIEGGK